MIVSRFVATKSCTSNQNTAVAVKTNVVHQLSAIQTYHISVLHQLLNLIVHAIKDGNNQIAIQHQYIKKGQQIRVDVCERVLSAFSLNST